MSSRIRDHHSGGPALRGLLKTVAARMGFEVRRTLPAVPRPALNPNSVSLDYYRFEFASIPGMIDVDRAAALYLLAYCQPLAGDIVELGSWQGRTTCFLAAACRDRGDGTVHAVDHFQGNPGTEAHYRVSSVSSLRAGFETNIASAGLTSWVALHGGPSHLTTITSPVRLLLVDAEHSYEAVLADLLRFAPLVIPGGLVVLDDHAAGVGVVDAAQEWWDKSNWHRPVEWGNWLLVRRRMHDV